MKRYSSFSNKKKPKSDKAKTWDAMSRYIRLRDALEYCRSSGINIDQFARPEDVLCKCVTCGAVKSWGRMDGGHCIGRGVGGGSGVYFNEKNLACQCKICNGMKQGARPEFEAAIIKKHGQDVMDELTMLHMTNQ